MSASVLMASWFKTHDRGEIIGSPCFGSMAGTHGNPGQVILTNSGLPSSISSLKLNTLRGVKGFEVSPDIPIKLGIQDLTEKRDPFKSYY
jgi:C-terminal processing protease CtpA/Prc